MPKSARCKTNVESRMRYLKPTQEDALRAQDPTHVLSLPALQCLLPHVKSGRLHSCIITGEYRLYFHRLYPRIEQPGRSFKWAFFIAKHDGPHIISIPDLQKVVIPHREWDEIGIKVHIDGMIGWDEMRGSAVLAETRMRITMPAGLTSSRRNGDEEKFHSLFPCDADFPVDYRVLEYTGEDAPES